jgi:hypothetical protein
MTTHTKINRFNTALNDLIGQYDLEGYEFLSDGDTGDWSVAYESDDPSAGWEVVNQYEITLLNQDTAHTISFVFGSYDSFLNGDEPLWTE